MTRFLAALAIVIASFALGAQPAAAHATYVRSNPAADARLLRAPAEIRITWSEEVDARFSEIVVLDPSGRALHEGRTLPGDDPASLRVGLRPLSDGGYTVSWRVLSSVDGHETRGSFVFALGDAPLPTLAIEEAGGGRTPTALELIGRWAGFTGIALVLGGGIFLLAVRPPLPLSVGPARVGALAVLASALLLITDQVLTQSRAGLGEALSGTLLSRQGLIFGLRVAAGVLALTALQALQRRPDAALGAALTVAGTLAAVAATLGSHAAAAGEPLDMANDLLHIIAMSGWAGGLVYLVVLMLRGAGDAAPIGALVWRFSLLALVSVGLLIVTGTLASIARLRLIEDLYETPYGVAIAVKILLLAAALALGARNVRVDLRTGARRVVVDNASDPALSPDGTYLVYVHMISDAPAGLWRVNTDGSGARPFLQSTDKWWYLQTPRFSPDGSTIAFSAAGHSVSAGPGSAGGRQAHLGVPSYLYLVDSAGRNLREVARTDDDVWPAWSPDGTKVAYVSGMAMHVLDVTAGKVTDLVAGDVYSYGELIWTPR